MTSMLETMTGVKERPLLMCGQMVRATTEQIMEDERCLVASVLESPYSKWSENVSTAFAFCGTGLWECSLSATLATAILEVVVKGQVPTRAMVKARLREDDPEWVDHPMFGERSSLPWSCVEGVALSLLPHYRSKQIAQTIGDAWCHMKDSPGIADEIARKLIEQLGYLVTNK